jgi:cytochrome b subunit of formate dehydrogenase
MRFDFLRFCGLLLLSFAICAGALRASAQPITNGDCLACHSDTTLTGTVKGKTVSLYINEKEFHNSAHGVLNCTDCHTDIKGIPHATSLTMPRCSSCHADQSAAYENSVHGKAIKAGDLNAARCVSCHGGVHQILAADNPNSPVFHRNIPNTCGACHKEKFVMRATGISTQVYFSYEKSVHGEAVAHGSMKAAVCTDCHGAHDILMAGNPKSPVFKFNVPATCGKCHASQDQRYSESIHWQAIQSGNWQAPVCTDCHGIHTIQAPTDHTVSAEQLAEMTCARCHAGVRLTREFGVPGERVSSYLDSYHGLASRLGSTVVANCASCHGAHLILPSSDPRSSVNKANLAETCGKCHRGATESFTRFPIHGAAPMSADIGTKIAFWIKRSYLAIIFLTIGAMLVHNFIIWRNKSRERREMAGRLLVVRMTRSQRLQHLVLMICFTVLVLSGFALISPFSSLADAVGFVDPIRRIVHRVAGVTLIVTGIYHLFYASVTKTGREMVKALLPEPKDASDISSTLRYHLRLSSNKPAYARFNYGEKFEYWALVWGTIVMATTGLMAWFQVPVTHVLPGWSIDVALTIHLYEAILATLAILVWHLYQVIFDPDVYPMNWSWWDGLMSLEEYKEEHPYDTETILEAERKGYATSEAADTPSRKDQQVTEADKKKDEPPKES